MSVVTERSAQRVTWNRLLRWAAWADLAAMAAAALAFRDTEAAVFAGLILAGLTFLRIRHGAASIAILGVLSLDVLAFMGPAAIKNIVGKQGYTAALVPASLAVISIAGVAAATGSIIRHRTPGGEHQAALVIQVVIAAFVVATGATVVQQRGSGAAPQAGDVRVDINSASYTPGTLTVEQGTTIAVRNADLFWHTFTVERTPIDIGLATRAVERRVIDLIPGRYIYYCAVPGHRQIGMHGTLIVT